LTTPRAAASAPDLVAGAAAVHHVTPGAVDQLAAGLRPAVSGDLVVALGGGRVIDTAKALAAADPPRRAAAVPTTLSGAEMTAIHRVPAGLPPGTPRVRPAIVVNDPALSASQDPQGVAASAMNALGHCVEAPLTPRRGPVSTLAALEGARLIAGALETADPDRDALALGALLGGYAIDAAGYGLHHIMSQSLVRGAGVGHGPANACMLPHTLGALRTRFPAEIARLDEAVDGDAAALAARTAERAGATRLRDLGVARDALPEVARLAAERPDLDLTPPRATERELLALYEAAW
jgi:alcohol dehydrogenase class IV